MDMASLHMQNLPHELLDNILKNLDFRDAINVAKTCRSLQAGALPVAYHSIDLEWYNGGKTKGSLPKGPRAQSLLRMLLDKPENAKLVKSLEFRARMCLYYDDDGHAYVNMPLDDVKPGTMKAILAEDAVKKLQGPNETSWNELSSDNALIQALIVGLCTKIQTLSISVDFLIECDWLKTIVHQGLAVIESSQRPPWFENLKSVRINSSDTRDILGRPFSSLRDTFLSLFYLNNVETLELSAFCDREDGFLGHRWPLNPVPNATNLTTLRLVRCLVLARDIDLILRQTPNLETFEYWIIMHEQSNIMQMTKLGDALLHVRSTLKHLTLIYDIYVHDEVNFEVAHLPTILCSGYVASLPSLPVLCFLKTSLNMLFNLSFLDPSLNYPQLLAQRLPPNLQRLTLTDDPWVDTDQSNYFDDVEVLRIFARYLFGANATLARSMLPTCEAPYSTVTWEQVDEEPLWTSATPALQEFRYESEAVWGGWDKWDYRAVWDQFRSRCEAQGIKTSVTHISSG